MHCHPFDHNQVTKSHRISIYLDGGLMPNLATILRYHFVFLLLTILSTHSSWAMDRDFAMVTYIPGFKMLPPKLDETKISCDQTTNHIFIYNSFGVSVSEDEGSNFILKSTNSGIRQESVNDVLVFGTKVFLAMKGGLYASENDFNHFVRITKKDSRLIADEVYRLQHDGMRLFAVAGKKLGFKNLFVSADGGKTFSNIPFFKKKDVSDIKVDGGQLIVLSSSKLYVSSDGGKSFEDKGYGSTSHDTKRCELNKKTYELRDDGLYVIEEYMSHKPKRLANYSSLAQPEFVDAYNSQIIIAANKSFLSSTNGGLSFDKSQVEDSYDHIGQMTGQFIGARTGDDFYLATKTGVAVSNNGGPNFKIVKVGDPTWESGGVAASDSNVYLIKGSSLYQSQDHGSSFQKLPDLSYEGVWLFPEQVFVSKGYLYLKLRGNYNDYIAAKSPGSNDFVTSLTYEFGFRGIILKVDGSTLYISSGDKIKLSSDGGKTFSQFAQLPSDVTSMIQVESDFFVGTKEGLFVTKDGKQIENVRLPSVFDIVPAVYSFSYDNGFLYVGTLFGLYRNGIKTVDIPAVNEPDPPKSYDHLKCSLFPDTESGIAKDPTSYADSFEEQGWSIGNANAPTIAKTEFRNFHYYDAHKYCFDPETGSSVANLYSCDAEVWLVSTTNGVTMDKKIDEEMGTGCGSTSACEKSLKHNYYGPYSYKLPFCPQ